MLLEKYSKEFNEYAADDDDDLEEYVGELLVIQDAMRNLTQWKSSAPPLPPMTLKTAMSRWRNLGRDPLEHVHAHAVHDAHRLL